MTTEYLNGFMLLVFQTMEKMNKEERLFLLRSVKAARNVMDLKYPLGKVEKDDGPKDVQPQ